jgi:oxalate decarboxylase/phosphoglucose isomerase-like protein (cupin superfamily)
MGALEQCRIIKFPVVHDPRGNLTFIESGHHIPFEVKRIYYLYDVPGGSMRAGHAHKTLHQILIAMSGSFDVTLEDGESMQKFHLNRSYYGLYICPMVWRSIDNFSSGSVCMALASDFYDELDYYRDYHSFLESVRQKK